MVYVWFVRCEWECSNKYTPTRYTDIYANMIALIVYHYIWWSRYLCLSKKKNRAICRPFTAKRNVRKIFSSLARKLVFWYCDLRNFFWNATFTVDFVFSLFCRSQLNFEQNKIGKRKILYFGLRVFCFIFIAKNGGTVVRLKLFIDIFWTSFTHMLKIPWWCGSLKCFYNWFK